jgi:hypothetical protein
MGIWEVSPFFVPSCVFRSGKETAEEAKARGERIIWKGLDLPTECGRRAPHGDQPGIRSPDRSPPPTLKGTTHVYFLRPSPCRLVVTTKRMKMGGIGRAVSGAGVGLGVGIDQGGELELQPRLLGRSRFRSRLRPGST